MKKNGTDIKIDFVIPWVDGNNHEWLTRFRQHADQKGDSREIRFRDWDLLRYWFRSVEKYTPWVHKVYFITSGEKPEWMNVDSGKLVWVRHDDYIPQKYLPTFNVNTIEMNLHRIKGLSEQFVYFNDDTFITRQMEAKQFFRNGLPCDMAVLTAKPAGGGIIHMAINDLDVLDRNFRKKEVVKKNLRKWFSLRYGKGFINNLLLSPWTEFSGFIDPHMPNAFLKSTFMKIWDKVPDILEETCRSKFRTNDNVNQWLIRYWQLAEGCFHPSNQLKNNLCADITDKDIHEISESISKQKYDMICLNDSQEIPDFERLKKILQDSFEKILPYKSSFEK